MPLDHEYVTSHFGHIFPVHIDALCELLIVLRQQFYGDLDLMLILAIISSRAIPARNSHTSNMSYAQFINDDNKDRADHPINIQSIAECSGIPRETVRRKVNMLKKLKLIQRDAQGMLEVTDNATKTLKPATEASLQYLITLSKGSSTPSPENTATSDLACSK